MEHARGLAQATAYAPGGKDASGDVNMYSVEGPPGIAPDAIEGMSWALAESVQAGDWELAESLQHSIYALKGSKGGFRKGLGKGKPGKGGASPAAAAKGAGAAVAFEGACRHYCGIWGHRMSDCRRLTAELGKAGKGKAGKGNAGGKGGPKGGKGPLDDPLVEVAAGNGDNWAGDLLMGALRGGGGDRRGRPRDPRRRHRGAAVARGGRRRRRRRGLECPRCCIYRRCRLRRCPSSCFRGALRRRRRWGLPLPRRHRRIRCRRTCDALELARRSTADASRRGRPVLRSG